MDKTASPSPDGRRAPGSRPGRIIVARHGKPALDREAGPRLDWRAYRDWWAAYEAGSLAPGQSPPTKLARHAAGAGVVFASMRPRSLETAQALAPDKAIRQDAVFNEAPLPPPQWSERRRYLPKTWNKIARLAWLWGHCGGEESYRATQRRAERAAEMLIAEAMQGADVLLAAHGWFNRMLRPPLRARGWTCRHDGGDGYWSFRIYERR